MSYIARIETACARLAEFPERGTPRDELRLGLRSVAFERRATIFYSKNADVVTIVHVVHRGRDLGQVFSDQA